MTREEERRETERQRKVVLLCHKFVAMAHEKVELTKFKSLVHMKQYVQQEGFLQSKKKKKTTDTQFVRLLLGYVNKLLG